MLLLSLYFYVRSIDRVPLVLLGVSIVTYCGLRVMEREHTRGEKAAAKRVKWISRIIILIDLGLLAAGRTTNLFAMLGNSYFTLKAIGYVMDVEREQAKYEHNYFRLLLYFIFFPTVAEGPFNRYTDFHTNLQEKAVFNYTAVMHGIQRFLWGAFKKLVISERIRLFVDYIYSDLEHAGGIMIVAATVGYAIQIYTDFSGYMDMMLGVAETFGIHLPENFKRPYFSSSVSEFWRRWHITLGQWFRDYAMYSFVMSKSGRKLGKSMKKISKKAGKLAAPVVGTILVWICTGVWHGFGGNYLLWGIYYGVIMCFALILEDVYGRMKEKCHIHEDSPGFRIFGMIRTWIVILFANVIIRCASLAQVRTALHKLMFDFKNTGGITLAQVGWGRSDVVILLISCTVLLTVSIMQEKGIHIRAALDRRNIVIRWLAYYFLLFGVLLFGLYGTEYDASTFLYMQF